MNYHNTTETTPESALLPFSFNTLTENALYEYIYTYLAQNSKYPINTELKTADHYSMTLLHCAAALGSTHLIAMLIDHNADLNSTNRHGYNALIWAIQKKQIDSALHLISMGISVEQTTMQKNNALHEACRNGLLPVAEKLLDINRDLAYKQNMFQKTPLDIAIEEDHLEVLKLFYRLTILPTKNEFPLIGHKSLLKACAKNDSDAINKILSCKLVRLKNYTRHIEAALTSKALDVAFFLLQKCTPSAIKMQGPKLLIAAVENNALEMINELLQRGVQPNDQKNENGHTAFHIALIDENIKLAQLLVEHGSPTETIVTKQEDSRGCECLTDTMYLNNLSPLHLAALYGRTKSVEYLLKLGAVDTPTKKNLTALHIAVHYEHEDIVRLLLAQQNNLLSAHYRGRSTYDYASYCYQDDKNGSVNFTIIDLLLKHGADATQISGSCYRLCPHFLKYNQKNDLPYLHAYALNREKAKIELLLKNGVNVNQKAINGITPLHIAAHYGFLDMVELLCYYGADKNIQDRDKKTAHDYATNNIALKNPYALDQTSCIQHLNFPNHQLDLYNLKRLIL